MKIRILALIMAVMMIVPLLFACAKPNDPIDGSDSGNNQTQNPTPEESTAAPSSDATNSSETGEQVPEDYLSGYNFNGDTITILAWSDYTMQEFEANGDMGEEIDTAIYKRNKNTEDRLGVKLEFLWEPCNSTKKMAAYKAKVKADLSDTKPTYDIFATYSRMCPQLAIAGYTKTLNEIKPLDFSKPWWPSSLINECTIGGKLQFCSGDISTNLLWMMIATFFNKGMLKDNNIEEPYQLVKDGKWTYEKLMQLTNNIYEDTDADGEASLGDTYGIVIGDVNFDAIATAGGFFAIKHEADGRLALREDFGGNAEKMVEAMRFVNTWLSTSKGIFGKEEVVKTRNVFREGRAGFIMDRVFIVAGKDNAAAKNGLDFDFGIVPNATFEENAPYYTNVGHPFTTYAISMGTHNETAAAATLESLCSEAYKLVTPAVFYAAMKLKYSQDSLDSGMWDIVRDNISFEIARLMCDEIGTTAASNFFRTAACASSFNPTSGWKATASIIKRGISKINQAYGYDS